MHDTTSRYRGSLDGILLLNPVMYGYCTCVLFLGFYMLVLMRVQVIHTYILIQSAKSVHILVMWISTILYQECMYIHISSYIYIIHMCKVPQSCTKYLSVYQAFIHIYSYKVLNPCIFLSCEFPRFCTRSMSLYLIYQACSSIPWCMDIAHVSCS